MPTVLLTAFEPFDGDCINPSWETARVFDGQSVSDYSVVSCCLPCTFNGSLPALESAIQHAHPDIVIALGQAGGRPDVTLERIAINLNDARIPDNLGAQPCDTPVVPHAPAAYFSTLPVKAIVQTLIHNGVPASISYTAGTFVCNHIFYGLQHLAPRNGITQSGFVHIPYLPQQAARLKGTPSMGQDTLIHALRLIIQSTIDYPSDLAISGGETH